MRERVDDKSETLTSSVPSPDIAKSGVFADVVPLLLSITMAPLAPTLSRIRAFSEKIPSKHEWAVVWLSW